MGSPIAINTVAERAGAKTALIRPRFRDVYAIGRGNRQKPSISFFHRPRPRGRESSLEDRGAHEKRRARCSFRSIRRVESLGRQLQALGIRRSRSASASYAQSGAMRTRRARCCGRHFPDLFGTLSHEILREFRE